MKYEPRKGPLPKRNPQTGGGGVQLYTTQVFQFSSVCFIHIVIETALTVF